MKPLATATQLASFLAEELRLLEMPKELWAHLTLERYVGGAVDPPDAEGVQECLTEARRFLSENSETVDGGKNTVEPSRPDPQLLTKAEMTRDGFFSEHIGEEASKRDDVRQLRKELLGELKLKAGQARRLLSSDATRFLPLSFFKARGIALWNHKTRRIDANGLDPDSRSGSTVLRITCGRSTHRVPYKREWPWRSLWRKGDTIEIPFPNGSHARISIVGNSVLDSIRIVAARLANMFPWEEHEAVWFLLTSEWPLIGPVRIGVTAKRQLGIYSHASIVMLVEPWVSAQTVCAIYKKAQRETLSNPAKSAKSFSEEKLLMFRFVYHRRRDGGKTMVWEELMREWNSTKPAEHYSDFRQFRRDYDRTQERVFAELLFPPYRLFSDLGKARKKQTKTLKWSKDRKQILNWNPKGKGAR